MEGQSVRPKVPCFTREQVYQHRSRQDAWMILHNKVYDVTGIADEHPGGISTLFDCVGLDGTGNFDDVSHSEAAWDMLEPHYMGDLVGAFPEATGSDDEKVGKVVDSSVDNESRAIREYRNEALKRVSRHPLMLVALTALAVWIYLKLGHRNVTSTLYYSSE